MVSKRRAPRASYRYLHGRLFAERDSPASRSRRNFCKVSPSVNSRCSIAFTAIPGQADAGELPAGIRWKKISIGAARVGTRRRAGSAPQDILVAHELPIVFAQCACRCFIAWIRCVRTPGPLPHIAEKLVQQPVSAADVWRRRRMEVAAFQKIS